MINVSQLNFWAICAGAVASFVLSGVWYTFLFGKPWLAALGISYEDVEDSGIPMGRALMGTLVASFLASGCLALLFSGWEAPPWHEVFVIAGLVWLGFSMTPMLKRAFWEDRPWTLIAIDGGFELVSILSIAAIVVAWR